MLLRPVTPDDAEATRSIYNAAVTSTTTFDLVGRTIEEQRAWIAEHSGAYPALVAVDEHGNVVGFGSLSRYRDRPAYSTTVEDSVYVADSHRRQGIGRVMLEELVGLAVNHGFHTLMARIEGGNEASIALHHSGGFELIGIEREVGRKFGMWLDVVVMQRLL